MRVLVGCEYSGIVRDAFIAAGHDAMSCDFLETEAPGPHYKGDVRDVLHAAWDLAIFHPECTHLAVSGARHFKAKHMDGRQAAALSFVGLLLNSDIPRIALENPVSIISTIFRKPEQIIQPHQFGHPEFKATCLWLKNLSPLRPTNPLCVPSKSSQEWKEWNKVHRMPPGPNRWKDRSRTFTGIAQAMAEQWGNSNGNANRQGDSRRDCKAAHEGGTGVNADAGTGPFTADSKNDGRKSFFEAGA